MHHLLFYCHASKIWVTFGEWVFNIKTCFNLTDCTTTERVKRINVIRKKTPKKKINTSSTMFNIIHFVKNIETDHSCNVVGCNDSLIQLFLMTHWPHLPKLSRVIIVKKKRMLLSCFELNLETSPYSFDKTACEIRRYNSLLSVTSDMSLLKDLRNQN